MSVWVCTSVGSYINRKCKYNSEPIACYTCGVSIGTSRYEGCFIFL